VGDANRLESSGEYEYTYDDEGNMVTKSRTNESWTYVWDHRNRLTSVIHDGPGALGDYTVTYSYDTLNRRTTRSVGTSNAELYVYDGDNVVIDYVDSDGQGSNPFAVARKYLYGPAVDQLLAMEDMSVEMYVPERVTWFMHDRQNTTRDLVNNAGAAFEHFKYDAFGNVTSGDVTITRYLWTGREFEILTGLQYNRMRWYDARIGRWISGEEKGTSLITTDAVRGRKRGHHWLCRKPAFVSGALYCAPVP
jgi:RHS repeat-associated protein